MELRHLRYFVAVAEEENASRAASKLRVSQPGVSQQIRDLEEDIGFPLFERTGRSMHLTGAGRTFLREARDILAHVADAVERARADLASPTEIHVGYVPLGTAEIVPRALRACKQSFPDVRVTLHDLSAEEMLPLLLAKKLDVALTLLPRKLPGELDMKVLAHYETFVVVGAKHPLAKVKSISPNQVASGLIAALDRQEYSGYHQRIRKMFSAVGRKPPRIGSEYDSGISLLAAVAGGSEVTLLPSCVSGMAGRRIKLLKLRPALPPWSVVALWRKDAEAKPVRAFLDATLPSRRTGSRSARRGSAGKPAVHTKG